MSQPARRALKALLLATAMSAPLAGLAHAQAPAASPAAAASVEGRVVDGAGRYLAAVQIAVPALDLALLAVRKGRAGEADGGRRPRRLPRLDFVGTQVRLHPPQALLRVHVASV